ncbi:DNA polymerase I [Alkaliphilus oremlandii]|uniref:DNA polymerase I n=1 Tax=Alkaliphilus oremlandii (strain OhILAs) TaxID=350688 RepID=A8MF83_ALKOO|nr:DNA polymerase I [Alkaliphilus oremlandii]ABW18752.1 DNA polymerase I [Alkaliphilus oremlandii OhILAs]
MEKRIVIIDGNSLINRAFYALPPLTNKEGQHTNAIYGFVTMLLKVMEDYAPDYIGVAFDKKAPTFRHKEYTEYKAGRKGMPPELAEQLEPLKQVLDALNIYRIELEGFEADDLIGTLAKHCEAQGIESLIVTGDRDALQLTSDTTKVLFTKKGISQLEIYDAKKVMEDYEVTPTQFIDLKGLMGDKSDNIPGVPGVGEKTAIKLLKQFETIENMIQNTSEIAADKLRQKIEENIEMAVLSKRLATIVTNVPVEMDLDILRKKEFDYERLIELFRMYEFNSLIPRIKKNMEQTQEISTANLGNRENIVAIKDTDALKKALEEIREQGQMVLKTITEENNIVTDRIVALAMTTTGEIQYYIEFKDFKESDIISPLKDILEDEHIRIIGHDLKKEIIHFYPYEIHIANLYFDTMVGEYLLNPAKSSYLLKDLALEYLGEEIIDEEKIVGKGKNQLSLWAAPENEVKALLCNHVKVIAELAKYIQEKIEDQGIHKLYYEVELPLVEVLASMEFLGIKVDRNMLLALEVEFKEIIDKLTSEIYSLAGISFNINSPKQLGEVLFEKLGLPPTKKTKTGYSTNADVLEKLQDQHEIIPKISEYRQVTKLKTTYVDGLLSIINPVTNRIHSSFNQTVTATGRISSTEPNLQNIPVRLEMGRRLRKVFISKEGHEFIDADYSQIELRVLAHIAKDDNLIDAFIKNQDIHTRTASEIFEVPMEEVTSLMRGDAKAVNFGIVYGISDFGLSQNLNIPVSKAKKYIESYFEKYPSIKEYMHNIVEEGKEKGYVVTLLNRRRYLPELKSSNFNIRSFGERIAMNTPIQGSAADIIKIAMIAVYNRLKAENYDAKLILQVHDELIIECPENEIEEVSKILKESMENAIEMVVPLKVDLSYANNWYDAK